MELRSSCSFICLGPFIAVCLPWNWILERCKPLMAWSYWRRGTVEVSLGGNEFCLMTSHLESTREHSAERINQLKTVFQKMQEATDSTTVIFAGDTNLRDQEVIKCGGLPDNVFDAWEFLGKPKHCRYTWDTKANDNLRIPAACKHRFDRIFFRAEEGHLIPQSLDLIGLERLDCGRFPSDHWGLLCTLNVVL